MTVTAVDGSNNVATCTFNVALELAPIDENPRPEDPGKPGKPGGGGNDSGGCSATNGAGSEASTGALLLGLALFRRRRRDLR